MRTRTLFVLLVALVCVMFGAQAAFALNTAVWSQASPAPNAVVVTKPTSMLVIADDAAPILAATVTLNGSPASFVNIDRLVGHTEFDEDSEEYYWVVDDWTKARIIGYFPSSRVLSGANTVVTTVTSSLGTSTFSRTFTYGNATVISAVTPLAGTTFSETSATITASLTSMSTSFTSSMKLDGVAVPAGYTAGTKTYRYDATGLAPGVHTVEFSARDSVGVTVVKSWSFTARPPMSTGDECGACHATVAAAHPLSGCESCHTHGYAPAGTHGSETPTVEGCTDSLDASRCHTFEHGVDSARGSGPFSCLECHDPEFPNVPQHTTPAVQAAHEADLQGCDPCHSSSLLGEHAKYPEAAAIKYQCDLCHGPNVPADVRDAVSSGETGCAACHAGGEGHEAFHVVDRTDECAQCHEGPSLTSVHSAIGCDPCHASEVPAVAAAIDGGDRDCSSCHGPEGIGYHVDAAMRHASPTTTSCFGAGCHDASRSLPIVHTNYAGEGTVNPEYATSCALCHDNADVDTTASGAACTGVCHSGTTHSGYAAGHATTSASQECTVCHGTDLSGIHGAGNDLTKCALCHGDPANGTKTAECASCHVGVDHEAPHATTVPPDCSGCHGESSLTSVHDAIDCSACHESVDPTVVAAIAGGAKECTACHPAQPHADLESRHAGTPMTSGEVHLFDNHDGMGSIDWVVECSMCHATTQLLTVHGNDCASCHSGAAPAAGIGTWNRTCQQGACHPEIPHDQASPAHDSIAGQNCDTCHENNWDVYYSTCEWCHDPAGEVAPVTTSDLKSAYVGAASINLNAPGIAYSFYRVDGGPRRAGSTVFVPGPASGTAAHTIEYWSVDDAGNEETPHKTGSFSISADLTPPTTSVTPGTEFAGLTTLTLTVVDNNSAPVPVTYWRLDGGAQMTGRTITIAPPASGSVAHTLEYWSVDASDNEESPHNVANFTVAADVVPPITSTNAPTYNRTNTYLYVSLTAVDPAPASGVAATYRRQNGYTYLGSYFYLAPTQGTHTFQYWSVDRAGNVETAKTATVIRDWTAPVTTSNAMATYEGTATVTFSSTDAVAGVASTHYTLDSDPMQTGTEVSVAYPGVHTIKFWSVDRAGNTEAQKTVTFTVIGVGVDTTAPVTTSDALASYSGGATIRLSATDSGGSGVSSTHWRLDGGAAQTGSLVNVPAPASGTQSHTLEYWSVDYRGNVEVTRSVSFDCVYSGTGTITLMWNAEAGSWAEYWVYNADGVLVAHASSDTIPGWDGWYSVEVPVDSRPYHWRADWYDSWTDTDGVAQDDALINIAGMEYSSWY